jgi:hypothetical protein
MRKLILVLTLGTSALAVTSVYLWTELRAARAALAAADGSSFAPGGAAPQDHGSSPIASVAASGTAAPTAATASAIENEKVRQRLFEEDHREGARRRLAQLADPTMRAQILEEWQEANLPNKPRYARYLGISEAEAERLIDLLAEQHLAQTEAYARCTLRPPCDYRTVSRESNAAQQQALTDLFGAEKQRRFEQYTYSNVERGMVSRFLRDRIPAVSQLSDEQAEQFVTALADERRLVEAEIKQRGLEPFVYPMEGVAFAFQNNVYQPGNTDDVLKEAADYNRRIHARAKAILTSQQLAAFEQMQEAAIVGVKYRLRQQERDLATRAAAPPE